MLALLFAGGPFMYATLLTSVAAATVFFYKLFFLFGPGRVQLALLTNVLHALEQKDYALALRLSSAQSGPLSRVLQAALQRSARSEKEIRRAVENSMLVEVPRLKGGTVYLPQLSNLATLFGLIGTIHGLIISFQGASAESAAARQAILSKGISIAFYNTFFGLTVATVCVVFYLILLVKTNQSVAVMERSMGEVIDSILWFRDSRPEK
jgi:biopolymer transport protein ExbB/TolQ